MKFNQFALSAFTLSELLISLSVIGLISAIAVPSIFNALEDNSKKARFKETYSILNNVVKKGVESGEMNHAGDLDYLKKNLNASKFCTNAWDYGCWPVNNNYGDAVASDPGFVMTSGVYVFGIAGSGTPGNDLYWIDINGIKGPNARCKDQYPVMVNVTDAASYGGTTDLKEGQVVMATTEKSFGWGCAAAEFPMN
jgi:prepilin-type N-terminal cleavage/methylation domain-containing protein